MFKVTYLFVLAFVGGVISQQNHMQNGGSMSDIDDNELWAKKYGKQIDQTFSGPLSFSHLYYTRCLDDVNHASPFDIAILGMPFDTAVTYRPGARFGPFAIRSGSRRQRELRGYSLSWDMDPFALGTRIIDCGDVRTLTDLPGCNTQYSNPHSQVPVNPFDNALAVDQMEVAYSTLLHRPVVNESASLQSLSLDGKAHPRIVTLGGDHTIVLPILRALHKVYGPVSVIHFDAHLDTWAIYPGATTEQSRVTHGTFFFLAAEEKLMTNTSIHAGIRCKMNVCSTEDFVYIVYLMYKILQGPADLENDNAVGFQLISTDDIDDLGIREIVRRIRARVGDSPVYLSLDIDVVDPGLAPASQFGRKVLKHSFLPFYVSGNT